MWWSNQVRSREASPVESRRAFDCYSLWKKIDIGRGISDLTHPKFKLVPYGFFFFFFFCFSLFVVREKGIDFYTYLSERWLLEVCLCYLERSTRTFRTTQADLHSFTSCGATLHHHGWFKVWQRYLIKIQTAQIRPPSSLVPMCFVSTHVLSLLDMKGRSICHPIHSDTRIVDDRQTGNQDNK